MQTLCVRRSQVLASQHPDHPFVILKAEYIAVRTFLANFTRLYTP